MKKALLQKIVAVYILIGEIPFLVHFLLFSVAPVFGKAPDADAGAALIAEAIQPLKDPL